VTRLRRIQYGTFKLEDLLSGAWREIPMEDVRKAFRLSSLAASISFEEKSLCV
jgi:16S rRNA U516 pseudouridylate synthase RsuA-like enzyme